MRSMFEQEQQAVETRIRAYSEQNGIPLAELKWTRIPFAGQWGISTSFFTTAAAEARAGRKGNVPQRAQELAEQIKQSLPQIAGIERVEAVKGYLNLFFSTPEYARRVADEVLSSAADFGRGAPKGE